MLQPEAVALSREVAERSFVLLKNDLLPSATPLLPLSPDVKSVAVIGPLGRRWRGNDGFLGGLGNGRDAVTLRAALNQKLGEAACALPQKAPSFPPRPTRNQSGC